MMPDHPWHPARRWNDWGGLGLVFLAGILVGAVLKWALG